MDRTKHIPDLILKKINGTITPEESAELNQWINEGSENKDLLEKLQKDEYLLEKLDIYTSFDKDRHKVWESIENELGSGKTRRLRIATMLRYAAILIPILMVAVSVIYLLIPEAEQEVAQIDKEFQPGTQKATLLLADGSSVALSEDNEKREIIQGDITIINDSKSLNYNTSIRSEKKEVLLYNELITPKGGTYELTLSDNTKIVLNAGSTLRFPVEFGSEKRLIYLTGEAYFKVQKEERPFIVSCEGMNVEVLGTSFNISAYSEDASIKTTLVEGSVQISAKDDQNTKKILSPDHQAVFLKTESQLEIHEVNTLLYTSWVNGKFEFSNENLDVVMRKLSRWYDFEYEFKNQDTKDFHFSARISNDQEISTILDMLEMTADVRFEVRDRKIEIFKTGTSN